jgi:DNA-binding beta-propeller fold protein YncE
MASGVAAAVPQQAGSAAAPAPPPNWPPIDMGKTGAVVRTRAGALDRAPVRYLRDSRPAFSAIAVNAENDIVMVADENNGRIVEYSRLDNTPPGRPPTEPRRVIEGLATHTEMPCAIYLDPVTLETRIINNDTQNWMPMFSREAQGNAAPDRILPTPQSSWGLTVDETHQEMFITVQGADAVVVYRKNAANFEVPLRILEGDATQLADTHGVAVDVKNDLLIVGNQGTRELSSGSPGVPRPYDEWKAAWERSMRSSGTGGLNSFVSMLRGRGPMYGRYELPSINIFPRTASENTAPLRVIKGPRTQLNWPSTIAVHEGRGEIFVANDADDSVLVFRVTDNGDVAPTRVIKGPRTQVLNPTGVALDPTNNEVWVASMGNYTLAAFPVTANGDVAPLRQIRGAPAGGRFNMVGNPGAVGYDSRRQEILVPN